jgi:histidine ammonia-lyase
MTVVVNSRADLTLDNYRRVAIGGEDVRIGEQASTAMDRARSSFMSLVGRDRTAFIYGITSGLGHLASFPVPPDEQRRRAQQMFDRRSRGFSFGGSLPERVVRGIVFARLANFVEGHAKVRPVVAERVAALLGQPLPDVPARGITGAGEILPLWHLSSALPAADYEEGEALALINGSPCAAALAADVALAAAARIRLAGQVFALSAAAFGAPLDAYDPALEALWPDPYERIALRGLRRWLAGVPETGRPYQAPVSFRVLPRVLAAAHRAVAAVTAAAETSLRAVTDNPVYILPTVREPLGRVLSTGGFHNAMVYPALDGLSAAWADLCTLADRHTSKLHDSAVSGLPHLLRPGGRPAAAEPQPTTFGLAMVQVGIGEEARHAASHTFLPGSEGGGLGQNDVSCPTFLAYHKHQRAAGALDAALAILAVTASQALWVAGRDAPPMLTGLLTWIRRQVPPVGGEIRQLGAEAGALAEAMGVVCLGGAPPGQADAMPGPDPETVP